MSEITISPEQPEEEGFLSRPLLASINLDWEKTIYLLFILVAILTRFWGLGDRVMSHDESLHTQFSYQFFDGQGYQHTPLMHGPFLFHITAISYWLFGDNDFAARLPVALFGVLLVVMPYFLRPWLGRIGAIFASFILLISPYVTYYSRYIRHDVYVIVWALIVFIAAWHYFRKRKDKYLWWFAAGTALMFATKEVAFIYVAIFGSWIVIRFLVQMLPAQWFREKWSVLRLPLAIALVGLILAGAGLITQRSVSTAAETDATVEATEGFAVDPNAEPTPEDAPVSETGLSLTMRWLQLAGIGVFALGLFLAVRALRPDIDGLREFDLIILFSTLVLPLASPLLTTIAGWNPTDYTLNNCIVPGQESLTSLQILFARLGNSTCWGAYTSSGIIRSGFFLVITLVISILVGLWWHRRRWITAAIIYYSILLVLYTSVFTNLAGWNTGIIGSLGYWLEQQEVQRGSQPSFYYFFVMPFYEFLPVIFSLLAMWFWSKKHGLQRVVAYWASMLILAFLAYGFTNWLYFGAIDPLATSELAVSPGVIVAGLIVLLSILYWFLRYRRQIVEKQEIEGGLRRLFQPRLLLEFVPMVVWWLLLTWVAYSYAGEKMPWLSIHFVIPMAFLVGWYFDEKLAPIRAKELLARSSLILLAMTMLLVIVAVAALGPLFLGRIQLGDQQLESLTSIGRFLGSVLAAAAVFYFWRRFYRAVGDRLRGPVIILSIFGLLSLLTIRFTYMASFPNADYTTEFMVYAHGAPATKSVVLDQVEELSMRLEGDKGLRVAFDSDVSWPLTWYLREYPNRVFFGENPSQSLNESPVIIVGAKNWGAVEPYLGNNYEYTEHTFLWWPMEEYRRISWNGILGDPQTANDQRRGLSNAGVREALWDIFFYRDYQKYGEVFGGVYEAGEWPLRHNLRMYIRKDTLPTLWDYGIGALAAGEIVDPYEAGDLNLIASSALNDAAVAGAGPGQLSSPRNMAVAEDGRIYVADSGNHRIQVFEPDGTLVNSWGEFGEGAGQFNEPWGIAVDDQNVYVADTWNHRLQKFDLDGQFLATLGASGSPNAESDDLGLGLFFGPRSVSLVGDDQLLVTDTGNHRMQLLDRDGNFLEQVGNFGNLSGQLNEPVGIAAGPDGSVYVADTWNSRIQQFTPELFAVNEWIVNAWEGSSINNKPYLAVDSAGRVYATDPEGYRILIFNPDGSYVGRFGEFGNELGQFGLPNGIAIDSQDNIYVADAGNNRVLVFPPAFNSSLDTAPEGNEIEQDEADLPEEESFQSEEDSAQDSQVEPSEPEE